MMFFDGFGQYNFKKGEKVHVGLDLANVINCDGEIP